MKHITKIVVALITAAAAIVAALIQYGSDRGSGAERVIEQKAAGGGVNVGGDVSGDVRTVR